MFMSFTDSGTWYENIARRVHDTEWWSRINMMQTPLSSSIATQHTKRRNDPLPRRLFATENEPCQSFARHPCERKPSSCDTSGRYPLAAATTPAKSTQNMRMTACCVPRSDTARSKEPPSSGHQTYLDHTNLVVYTHDRHNGRRRPASTHTHRHTPHNALTHTRTHTHI